MHCHTRRRAHPRQFRYRRDCQSAPAQRVQAKDPKIQEGDKYPVGADLSRPPPIYRPPAGPNHTRIVLFNCIINPLEREPHMARIKLAYIGGGSTRAAGTMASFIHQGENFNGSEVVLVDLNEERLGIVQTLAQKMAWARDLDLTIRATTNGREGLQDCDADVTSFRPGGFEARYLDESIPLKYGVIGQETQGPGGFFMALRSIHVMKSIIEDMEAICPRARLFN